MVLLDGRYKIAAALWRELQILDKYFLWFSYRSFSHIPYLKKKTIKMLSLNYSKIALQHASYHVATVTCFGIRDFLKELSFLGPSIISGTLHTHLCRKFESVKILKFKLNIHIAAITIPNSDKPSPLHIHRRISMGCAYKRP